MGLVAIASSNEARSFLSSLRFRLLSDDHSRNTNYETPESIKSYKELIELLYERNTVGR